MPVCHVRLSGLSRELVSCSVTHPQWQVRIKSTTWMFTEIAARPGERGGPHMSNPDAYAPTVRRSRPRVAVHVQPEPSHEGHDDRIRALWLQRQGAHAGHRLEERAVRAMGRSSPSSWGTSGRSLRREALQIFSTRNAERTKCDVLSMRVQSGRPSADLRALGRDYRRVPAPRLKVDGRCTLDQAKIDEWITSRVRSSSTTPLGAERISGLRPGPQAWLEECAR